MAVLKATLLNMDTGESVFVPFNPEEYTLEGGNQFAEFNVPGRAVPPLQYVRGRGRTLRMELLYDALEFGVDIRGAISLLTDLLTPNPTTLAPPILLFSWGSFQFRCVIDQLSQRFTLFYAGGSPARAYVTLSLKEYESFQVRIEQGLFIEPPTVRNLREGQTLSQVSAAVLGDPGRWRELARANGITDPFRLGGLASIVVPPRSGPLR